jgi:predicted ribosome quality control (RQC) complex YloA/Tae2 family protein
MHWSARAQKAANQRTELIAAEKRERLRQQGDIITANLWNMKKGQRLLRAENFYDPAGGVCEIPLDPLKTPQQNAAKYYKEYTKARNAEKFLTEQIAIAEREEEYLASVLDELSRAEGESDLSESDRSSPAPATSDIRKTRRGGSAHRRSPCFSAPPRY